MRYLIVRCTTYDMAGVAMIQGAMVGMRHYDKDAEFASLAPRQHVGTEFNPCPSFDPADIDAAYKWADVVLNIAGLCKGRDRGALEYLQLANKMDKPYCYMAQSFWQPVPAMFKGAASIVARGYNSQKNVFDSIGRTVPVAADLAFLVDPVPWNGDQYDVGFTTHNDPKKDYSKMFELAKGKRAIQIKLKMPQGDRVWEEDLGIDVHHGSPASIFGLIRTLKEVHTARYHTGVGAVMFKVPMDLYVGYQDKYHDLADGYLLTRSELRDSAMISCHEAWAAITGKEWWNEEPERRGGCRGCKQ